MNKINVQQAGGYRFETNTLDFITKAYEIFNVFGELAGDKTILSGCNVIGSTTTDGFVYYNGELFPFKGDITQPNVIIRETETPLVFQNGDSNAVFFDRWIEFGVGTGSIPWNEFLRYQPHQYINNSCYASKPQKRMIKQL